MNTTHYNDSEIALTSWVWITSPTASQVLPQHPSRQKIRFAPLAPIRNWLDAIAIQDQGLAHWLCRSIPSQCPFERDITFFGRTLIHIPPLCKLNPFYEQVVGLRFRALCFLADECGEDVTPYC
jgi:hypothetical protein